VSPLDVQVLVLNRLWQPVNTCTARRAVTLVFLGHAHIVHHDEQDNYTTHDAYSWIDISPRLVDWRADARLRSVRCEFAVPEIIVLSFYDRLPKKEIKFTRQNVFMRDRFTCQYCAKSFDARELNLDHVLPRDKGGRTTWENVVTSCIRCNSRKANKLPHEARMVPLQKPRAPRWRPFHSAIRQQAARASWQAFLEADERSVEISH
jgi:5-methylcytosine-specific restriction endonuclease McrA